MAQNAYRKAPDDGTENGRRDPRQFLQTLKGRGPEMGCSEGKKRVSQFPNEEGKVLNDFGWAEGGKGGDKGACQKDRDGQGRDSESREQGKMPSRSRGVASRC